MIRTSLCAKFIQNKNNTHSFFLNIKTLIPLTFLAYREIDSDNLATLVRSICVRMNEVIELSDLLTEK